MKNLVVCGDSFSIGIGCEDLINQPYGSLLAKKLNCKLVNFAKGSSTNLSIYLQIKYAVENINSIEYLIIAPTCHHRVEFFPEKSDDKFLLDNLNVNYHQYPPYGENTNYQILDNHPYKDNPKYRGEMFTENWHGILNYVTTILPKKSKLWKSDYYAKFENERDERFLLLEKYYYEIFDARIQKIYDNGAILMGTKLCEINKIPYIVLTNDEDLKLYLENNKIVHVDWGMLSELYPDKFKSLHTSEVGHKIVYDELVKRLNIVPKII